ncbi:MAG: glycosyltransferase family 2 protein [Cytophagaceae bacterium]|nr:glycosyltransferase family 2 protein [Cytophagaceae bacterium]
MPSQKQSWSILIFCFNEVETVAKVTNQVLGVLEQMAADSYEVLLVDDGSTDGSQPEIERIARTSERISYRFHPENLGIGHALRTGYFNVKYENVCAVPADGQFDVQELLPFSVVEPNTFISFYRKENTTYTPARNALSYFNRMLNKWLNGVDLKDVNWVKIYKTDVLSTLNLEIESSLVESEICAKLIISGNRVLEVPSKYLPREAGVSKGASMKIVRQAMTDTLLLGSVLRRFRKSILNE